MKKIYGWLLMLAFAFSVAWKLSDSSARFEDGAPVVILILLVMTIIFFLARKILRS